MARPTTEQQKIISARNDVIVDLVVRKGFSQSEVGRFFNLSRAIVNQVVKESQQPDTLGYKLLKEYICKKLNEAEEKDEFASLWGLSWRANRGALMDYPMTKNLEQGYCDLWDEMYDEFFEGHGYPKTKEELEKYSDVITSIEDIVITHKGAIVYVIRIGRGFSDDEYVDSNMTKISIPLEVLNMEEIPNLTQYVV